MFFSFFYMKQPAYDEVYYLLPFIPLPELYHCLIIRINTTVTSTLNSNHPVEFTIRQPGSRLAWDIPNKWSSSTKPATKTICPFSGNETIDIIVSTTSSEIHQNKKTFNKCELQTCLSSLLTVKYFK